MPSDDPGTFEIRNGGLGIIVDSEAITRASSELAPGSASPGSVCERTTQRMSSIRGAKTPRADFRLVALIQLTRSERAGPFSRLE